MQLSISLKFYKELQQHGADALIRREYGPFIATTEIGIVVAFLLKFCVLSEGLMVYSRNMKFAKLILTIGIIAVDVFIWIHIGHVAPSFNFYSSSALILMVDGHLTRKKFQVQPSLGIFIGLCGDTHLEQLKMSTEGSAD